MIRNVVWIAAMAVVLFCGIAPANAQTFANRSSGLCLAVQGGVAANGAVSNYTPLVTTTCAPGSAAETFVFATDGSVRLGSAGSPYCMEQYLGTVNLIGCMAGQWAQVVQWGSNSDFEFIGLPGKTVCAQANGNGPVVTATCVQGQANQMWAAPAAAAASTTVALNTLLNPNSPLDGNGCLIDKSGNTLGGGAFAGCHNYFVGAGSQSQAVVYSNGAYPAKLNGIQFNIVSSGAGNIVSSGAGNIVSSGAGNIQAGAILMRSDGTAFPNYMCIVSSGAGNIVSSGAGNIVSSGAGNIILIGGSNIVSSGAGNIVSSGAGNFSGADPSTVASLLASLKIVSTNGSNVISLPNQGALSTAIPGGLIPITDQYKTTSVAPGAAGTAGPFSFTHFSVPSTWANNSSMQVTWQYAGTPAASQSVNVYLQVGGNKYPVANPVPVANKVSNGSYGVNTTPIDLSKLFSGNVQATVLVTDGQSTTFSSTPVVLALPVVATFSFTGFGVPNTWTNNTSMPVTWQYTGTPTATTQTVYVYLQVANGKYPLTGPIPVTNKITTANYGVNTSPLDLSKSFSGNMPGLILVTDAQANTLSSTPVTLILPATVAFHFSGIAIPSSWANNTPTSVTWQFTGTPAANQAIYVYLQVGSGKYPLVNNVPFTNRVGNSYGATIAAMDWSRTYSASFAGAVTVTDAQGNSLAQPTAMTIVLPATAAKPPVTQAPAAAPASAVLYSLKSFQLTDSNPWTTGTTHILTWVVNGTAPYTETVSFMLQTSAGLLRMASGIPAGQKSYSLNINNIKAGTTGVVVLKDDITGQQISGPTVSVK